MEQKRKENEYQSGEQFHGLKGNEDTALHAHWSFGRNSSQRSTCCSEIESRLLEPAIRSLSLMAADDVMDHNVLKTGALRAIFRHPTLSYCCQSSRHKQSERRLCIPILRVRLTVAVVNFWRLQLSSYARRLLFRNNAAVFCLALRGKASSGEVIHVLLWADDSIRMSRSAFAVTMSVAPVSAAMASHRLV
jgi:hypothetical protein